ncbi:hypothetical protein H0H92_006519 [Tricholoma furcatifolium]|nr:hypothetical protein H0H92_006519 [Tricholoma furcatifolium]
MAPGTSGRIAEKENKGDAAATLGTLEKLPHPPASPLFPFNHEQLVAERATAAANVSPTVHTTGEAANARLTTLPSAPSTAVISPIHGTRPSRSHSMREHTTLSFAPSTTVTSPAPRHQTSSAPRHQTLPVQSNARAHNALLRALHGRHIAHSTAPDSSSDPMQRTSTQRSPSPTTQHRPFHGGHPHGIRATSGPGPPPLARPDAVFPAHQTLRTLFWVSPAGLLASRRSLAVSPSLPLPPSMLFLNTSTAPHKQTDGGGDLVHTPSIGGIQISALIFGIDAVGLMTEGERLLSPVYGSSVPKTVSS